jgi:hypothetical protein
MVVEGGTSQKIGLQAYLGTEAFDKAMQSYMAATDKINSKNATVAQGMSQKMGGATNVASGAFSALSAKTVALGMVLGTLALSAINKVVNGLKQMVSGALDAAGRTQELSYVAQIMANNAGIAYDAIEKQVQGIKNLGIRTDEAYNAVIKFMQSELDMSKAAELARVAQDAAVIAQTDSSDAYQRLIYAVTTYNTETLRTMGFNLRSDTVFQEYAATLGKTATELTQTEKSQAFLNAVIAEGGKIAGAYEAAMETPGKQMRSWKRDVFELTRVLGEPFLNAYANVAKSLRDVTQAFQKAFDVGGPFHGFMVNLGGAAALVTEEMGKVSKAVSSFIISLGTKEGWQRTIDSISGIFGTDFNKLINDATSWGSEFIQSFANGIIDGVVAVINALAYVGSVISGQLSANSPPKLLPDIDKWGKAAMNQYLKGFSQADFDIFKDIGNIMASFIKSTAKGDTDTSIINKILGGRKALADAIAQVNKVGAVTDAMVNKVAKAAGLASKEFKAYVKAMLQSELASKALAAAQANLVRITSSYDAILKGLNDQLDQAAQGTEEQDRLAEIEQAMASGLLTESEMASLANEKRQIELRQQIRTTEDARDAEVSAAQDKVDAAQAQMDAISAQIELQKSSIDVQIEQNNLIREQIKLMEQQAAAAKAATDAAKVAGGGAGGVIPPIDIKDKMKDAIDAAKLTIKAKLAELWATFKAKFKPIEDAWNNLKKKWAPVIKNAFGDLKTQFGGLFVIITDVLQGKWNKVPGDIWRFIKTGFEILWKWIQVFWNSIDWGKLWDTMVKAFGDLGNIILEAFGGLWTVLVNWFNSVDWGALGKQIIDGIVGFLTTAGTWIVEKFIELREALIKWFLSIDWGELAHTIITGIGNYISKAWPWLLQAFLDIMKAITDWFNGVDWGALGKTIMDGIAAFITTAWNLAKGIGKAFVDIVGKIWKYLTEEVDWGAVGAWIIEAIRKIIAAAWDLTKSIGKAFVDLVSSIFKWFKEKIDWSALGQWIIDAIVKVIGAAWDTAKDIGKAFADMVANIFKWFKERNWAELGQKVIDAIVTAIKNGAGAIWDAIKNAIGVGGGGGGEGGNCGNGYYMGKDGQCHPNTDQGHAAGGLVSRRGLYELAERGPELVLPADITKALFKAYRSDLGNMRSYNSGNSYNNSKTVNLVINPSYETVQSPAGIRYDVTAALMAARM